MDLACLTVGRRVELAAAGQGRRGETVEDVLGLKAEEKAAAPKPDPRRFGQLAWRARKKMAVPESGIW